MVEHIKQLKEALKEKKLVFGICECLKNSGNISGVYVAADARQESEEKIKNAGVSCIRIEAGKEEISKNLEISFKCEIFSILNAPRSSVKMQKISEKAKTGAAKGIKKEKK